MSLAKNITGTTQIYGAACRMVGFYVNSTSSGTIVVRDGDSGGVVKSGTITPAIGFHPFPASCAAGLHITTGGTINATVFYDA